MLSVIIPTLDAERDLAMTLESLVAGAVEGLVGDVVVADGGSRDATRAVAEQAGCEWITASLGRGTQLAAGAKRSRQEWLLFLHADTKLSDGWIADVERFIGETRQGDKEQAAVFRFALGSRRWRARMMEALVRLRCVLFALPYGDQGLLISREFYDRLGGFRDMPIMEDVDIVRRIGRNRLVYLPSRAMTSAARYERCGYLRRSLHNLTCLCLYFAGAPLERIRTRYG